MKRLSLVLAVLAVCTFTAKAQDSFRPGVFIQLQGGASYDFGEAPFAQLISPAAQASLGYQFSNVFGMRLAVSGWQARNFSTTDNLYKYQFVQPSLDFMFNLSTKAVRPYLFLGGGAAVGLDNADAIDLSGNGSRFSLLWEPTKVFWVGRAGFGTDFRLTDWLAFNLELNANVLPDTFNSKEAVNNPKSPDFRFNALAGFTIRFGAKSRKPAVAPVTNYIYSEPVEQPKPKEEVVVEEPQQEAAPAIHQGADVDIFFDLNKAVIRDSEVETLNLLVNYLRNNPGSRVQLDGYADRATGTPAINQELSEQRVAAVRQYLMSRGIATSRISVDAHGDTVQPFSGEKNRAVTCRIR